MRRMWRGWIIAAALFAVPALGQQQAILRELTTTKADVVFEDEDGTAALPSTLTAWINDRTSRLELMAPTSITPGDNPCVPAATGCVRIPIPATAQAVVGKCATMTSYCRNNADCPVGKPCQLTDPVGQEHVLSLQWTYSGGQGAKSVVFKVKNEEFIYFPTLTVTPTSTPTATPTNTPTNTATASATATTP